MKILSRDEAVLELTEFFEEMEDSKVLAYAEEHEIDTETEDFVDLKDFVLKELIDLVDESDDDGVRYLYEEHIGESVELL